MFSDLIDQRKCIDLVLNEIREYVLALYSMRSENMYWPCTPRDQRKCIGPVLYGIREHVLALYSMRSENMYWPCTL